MYRIAIVEDEEGCREQLRGFVDRYFRENGGEVEVTAFTNGMDFVSDYRPVYDIVLMDIKMPHLNGMDAAKKMRRMDPDVCLIFVTNLAQYAIQGYSVDAIDFAVKPVTYADFAVKLRKACAYSAAHREKFVTIKCAYGFRRVSSHRIRYVEVTGHSLIYHCEEEDISVGGSLDKAEQALSAPNFARCSKCYLVNLDYVTGINAESVILGKDELVVSRRRKKEFFRILTTYLGGGV